MLYSIFVLYLTTIVDWFIMWTGTGGGAAGDHSRGVRQEPGRQPYYMSKNPVQFLQHFLTI